MIITKDELDEVIKDAEWRGGIKVMEMLVDWHNSGEQSDMYLWKDGHKDLVTHQILIKYFARIGLPWMVPKDFKGAL